MGMKYLITIIVLSLSFTFAIAQNVDVNSLVDEGIKLYDEGKYIEASDKYIQALEIDSTSSLAQYELAMTYFSMKDYEKSIVFCKKVLSSCQNEVILKQCYPTYGSCLDEQGKYEEAVRIFLEGIDKYPNALMLNLNLGITYLKHKEYDEAKKYIISSIKIKPDHPSSHFYLGVIMEEKGQRIPAIMAYSRYLILDPKSSRAKKVFPVLLSLMVKNVEKGEGKNVTLYMTPQDTTISTDDFYIVDMILTMAAGLDYDSKNKDKTEVELFANKYMSMCEGLKEQKPNNKGFFWDYYAPYFIELKNNNYIKTVAYMFFFFNRDEKYTDKWVEDNQDKIKEMLKWSDRYEWNSE
jgi:tetratricopeptide (TPR) repeat protein